MPGTVRYWQKQAPGDTLPPADTVIVVGEDIGMMLLLVSRINFLLLLNLVHFMKHKSVKRQFHFDSCFY
jgi:hypothetical protein